MGRRPCCAKEGLNRGAWTAQEDKILCNYINIHGEGKWRDLPQRAGLKRCGKSCRLRWLNYLRPDIKRGNISVEEEELIIKLHKLLGNRWSLIAGRLPGRTDNEIKNYWNTNLSKRMHGHKTQNAMKNQNKLIRDKGSMEDSCKPGTRSEPHKVIRTKAVRCTKVVIPQPLDHNQMLNKNEALTREDHDSPSTSPLVDQDDSSNFLSDFDIGDLFISEVLNSECHREGGENDVGGGYGGDGMIISTSSGFPPCEEDALQSNSTNEIIMLEVESWKGSDQLLQSIDALEIKRLASFFDSEEDWIT